MWTSLTVLAGSCAFAAFAWALRAHFAIDGGMPKRMRDLSRMSAAAFVLFAALSIWRGVGMPAAIAAIICFATGISIFWWAVRTTRTDRPAIAFSEGAPDHIYTRGPYAYVRHPFYLAYCVAWIGTAIAAGPLQWLPAAALVFCYFRMARSEEAHFAGSALAEDYARYRRQTGLIVPRFFQ